MHWMFLPLKRYVDFTGRSRRMEFWMWKLFQFLVGMAFTIIIWVMAISVAMTGAGAASRYGQRGGGDPGEALAALGALGGISLILTIVYLVWSLFIFLPDLAVTIRRLHDSNRTGWWVMAPAVPYLIGVFAFLAGTMGAVANAGSNGRLSDSGGAVLGGGIIVFFLCMLIALGLGILLLVFLFLDGTNGPNRFGPDPKAGQRGYDQTFA